MIPLTHFLAAAWAAAAPPAPSAAAAAPSGYVVKVETGLVYIDLGAQAGAVAGQPFAIYTEGAELKHPVTGAVLGRQETVLAEGVIKETFPLYATGSYTPEGAPIAAGQRARLGQKPAPAPAQAAQPGPAVVISKDGIVVRQPRWRSPALDLSATGMAIGDFKGPGQTGVAISDHRRVRLYAYPPGKDAPEAEYTHAGTAPRIYSLEAADMNGNGRAEIFAALYNQTFGRVETAILEYKDGTLEKIAEIPGLVRAHQDGEGNFVLAVQQLMEDQTFPYANIFELEYRQGKYGAGKKSLRPHKRVDFIYGFTRASFDGGEPATVYLTSTNDLRVQFKKGYWKSKESYGQTPSRLRWMDKKMLEFHPPFRVAYGDDKKAALYAVRNISMLGSLSEPFGLFNDGEVHKKTWNGVSLQSEWKTSLGGYSPAIALVPGPRSPKDLAVAVVSTSGKSSVWIYDP